MGQNSAIPRQRQKGQIVIFTAERQCNLKMQACKRIVRTAFTVIFALFLALAFFEVDHKSLWIYSRNNFSIPLNS